MNVAPFLEVLRSRDIRVWAEGDRLRCDGPPGALTAEVRDQLRAAKPALLEFLRTAQRLASQPRALVPLNPAAKAGPEAGGRPVLFGIGGHNGDVFCFRPLAQQLGPEQPFYGLQPPGADGNGEPLERVEDLAAYFFEQIRAFQPRDPYHLVGYCAGGTVAFELAQQARRSGRSVRLLALIGSPHPHQFRPASTLRRHLHAQWQRVAKHAKGLGQGDWQSRRHYLGEALAHRRRQREENAALAADAALAARSRLENVTLRALGRYRLRPYEGRLVLFLPDRDWMQRSGLAAGWASAASRVEEHYGPEGSDGDTLLREEHAPAFAAIFRRCLESEPAPIDVPVAAFHGVPSPVTGSAAEAV